MYNDFENNKFEIYQTYSSTFLFGPSTFMREKIATRRENTNLEHTFTFHRLRVTCESLFAFVPIQTLEAAICIPAYLHRVTAPHIFIFAFVPVYVNK